MTSSAATTAAEPHQHQQSASRLTERRCSGVLLHLTCLPSAHGIGDLGVLCPGVCGPAECGRTTLLADPPADAINSRER